MSTTTEMEMNESGLTFAYPSDVTGLIGEEYAECDDVTCVLTTPEPLDLSVCERLAPPPVPPWLQDAPSRLHEMTRHCRSWTLYQELCQQGAVNSTWLEPPEDHTTVDEGLGSGPRGVQWVIPALALVVVVLLVLLAAIMYKYYRHPSTRAMYRVAGGGSPLKRPTVAGGWAGGALVEGETSDSNLSAHTHDPDLRYTRSPVCRLLEHTQYVATPTVARVRQHPGGPPAFTCPAYFLPALSWLRLPILQHVWPKEGASEAEEETLYHAAHSAPTGSGEIIYRWATGGGATDEPEYSEIWEGQQPAPDGELDTCGCKCAPMVASPVFLSSGSDLAGPRELHHQLYHPLPTSPTSLPPGVLPLPLLHEHDHHHHNHHSCSHHGWHHDNTCGSGGCVGDNSARNQLREADGLGAYDLDPKQKMPVGGEVCHPSLLHCGRDGWLAQYRLPRPSMPGSCGSRAPPVRQWLQEGPLLDDMASDSELLLEHSSLHGHALAPSRTPRAARPDCPEQAGGTLVVKYPNLVYEGNGHVTSTNSRPAVRAAPAPLVSRLWGFLGWSKR